MSPSQGLVTAITLSTVESLAKLEFLAYRLGFHVMAFATLSAVFGHVLGSHRAFRGDGLFHVRRFRVPCTTPRIGEYLPQQKLRGFAQEFL